MKFEPVVKSIYKKHDYHEFGGAPLLGANGICMICHGSSEARTITNAVAKAREYALKGVNDAISAALLNHDKKQLKQAAAAELEAGTGEPPEGGAA